MVYYIYRVHRSFATFVKLQMVYYIYRVHRWFTTFIEFTDGLLQL
jgi:hypothetical protein